MKTYMNGENVTSMTPINFPFFGEGCSVLNYLSSSSSTKTIMNVCSFSTDTTLFITGITWL